MKIVVLTGAGMSAESGLKTFRDTNGLWEGHRVEDVATPEAWWRNPALVLDFYRQRYEQLLTVEPNAGHLALAALEARHAVQIITQNVDDLHERAGSTAVLHLHGQLRYVRSSKNSEVEPIRWPGPGYITGKELHADGSPLRPHIVWFGEAVPAMEEAIELVAEAELLLIVGTSLQVYPAASLYEYAPHKARIVAIDPHLKAGQLGNRIELVTGTAAKTLPEFLATL